ncbi:AAA family ATPase [Streptomyces sp. 8L]|uniref:AAA family ATPase n=1 Tax=Streptomyces sp. 8L TaxID=2877242 RepID=UPI001CD3BE7B|nr:AAA family ATPase [Streptomyces sp. 8L]MCA1216870.1 ATP-binding protein [Streptomyces sp. 8L]
MAGGVLALGQTVIADAVDAVEAAREQWRSMAGRHGVPVAFIEVVCSDPVVHRRRLEGRSRGIDGSLKPTWEAVERLREEFAPWIDPRLVLDAVTDVSSNVAAAA